MKKETIRSRVVVAPIHSYLHLIPNWIMFDVLIIGTWEKSFFVFNKVSLLTDQLLLSEHIP